MLIPCPEESSRPSHMRDRRRARAPGRSARGWQQAQWMPVPGRTPGVAAASHARNLVVMGRPRRPRRPGRVGDEADPVLSGGVREVAHGQLVSVGPGREHGVIAVSPRADHLPQPCTGDALLQGCAQAHQVHSDGLAIAPVGVGGVLDRVRVHQVLDQRRRGVVGGQGGFPVLKPAIQHPASRGGVHVGVDRAGHIRDHRSAAGAPDFAHERTIAALAVLPETDNSWLWSGLGFISRRWPRGRRRAQANGWLIRGC
jgi:hypothetical protein